MIDRENRTYPEFNTEHKARCKKCRYHGMISGGTSQWSVICQYILVTGEKRPCAASDCTVYEKGNQARTMAAESFLCNMG